MLLFEGRFGGEVYRPVGMDWFTEGYWKINDKEDTAKQFLGMDQVYIPTDGTPPLNIGHADPVEHGTFHCMDPGAMSAHRACTLEYFKSTQFDYVIASIPDHVEAFEELIEKYQPKAKLIIQMGNNWNISQYEGKNVMASMKFDPKEVEDVNAIMYHQEFDRSIFYSTEAAPSRKIYSFVNCIKEMPQAWSDYQEMKEILEPQDFILNSFGGQCPDGNMNGPKDLAQAMWRSQMVFHVKPGGDGFGHIIHNAYACGRPVITRKSFYAGQLAENLMVSGTFIDIDDLGVEGAAQTVVAITEDPDILKEMGEKAANRFNQVVDYVEEAKDIREWLEQLN